MCTMDNQIEGGVIAGSAGLMQRITGNALLPTVREAN